MMIRKANLRLYLVITGAICVLLGATHPTTHAADVTSLPGAAARMPSSGVTDGG